jgi:hypothetical protein
MIVGTSRHLLQSEPPMIAFRYSHEQLDDLRCAFGFFAMERLQWREMLAWLLPVALATTRAPAIATR